MVKYFDGARQRAVLRALLCAALAFGLASWHAIARADGDDGGRDGDDTRIQVLSSAPHLPTAAALVSGLSGTTTSPYSA